MSKYSNDAGRESMPHREPVQRAFQNVYVYYPRGSRTGGPEALHQLVHTLREQDIAAYLVPTEWSRSERRVPEYRSYDAPEAQEVVDHADNCVVVPERLVGQLRESRNAQKFCWWLSIDNARIFQAERAYRQKRAYRSDPGFANFMRRWLGHRTPALEWRIRGLGAVQHLTQSQYAWSYLNSRFDILPSALSDYTPLVSIGTPRRADRVVISFNPAKGGEYVEGVKSLLAGTIEWVAIEGMSTEEVHGALGRSDIYLDLGHQPGKDRLPREAAAAGAVVVLMRRGAGAYSQDTPIPAEHKVNPNGDISRNAADVLLSLQSNLAAARHAQSQYRKSVAAEREVFRREVMAIFGRRQFGWDHGSAIGAASWMSRSD
ncbi:hypothetical protein [Nocardioides panaciterrulae]|uniref:Glycosyltransferase family 1 protein n=1 Tax=Nocardioides panaciterrulae TaxID=661492 RepID=A0A7Y9E3E8_9ACTN|nr:hypothetical protein [Nocardioides panaciterrulae]NYD40503.1 hypothetical protein [Nocardioides panaciterrulae]